MRSYYCGALVSLQSSQSMAQQCVERVGLKLSTEANKV